LSIDFLAIVVRRFIMKFIDLLVENKNKSAEKHFIQYLMDKYAAEDILDDDVSTLDSLFIKEDRQTLYKIINARENT